MKALVRAQVQWSTLKHSVANPLEDQMNSANLVPSAATLKYQNEITAAMPNNDVCPPSFAIASDICAYRWVFNPHTNNCFLPPAIKKPARVGLEKNSNRMCGLFGLSMHTSELASESAYKHLQKSFRNINKTMGDHIAMGVIKASSGVYSPPDNFNHIDVYEYAGNSFLNVFQVVKEIK